MPKTFAQFYSEVEDARNLLVPASIWYAAKGDKDGAKELNRIVSQLVGWCDDWIPSTGVDAG